MGVPLVVEATGPPDRKYVAALATAVMEKTKAAAVSRVFMRIPLPV
jgi:hypothetical protein